MKRMVLALILTLPISGFSSTVFKWQDDKGVTHYSSQPLRVNKPVPAKSNLREVDQNSGSKNIPTSITKRHDKKSYCHTLKNFMSVLNGELGILIEVKDAQGNYNELDSEERIQKKMEVLDEFNSICI